MREVYLTNVTENLVNALNDLEQKEMRLNELYFDLKLSKNDYNTKYNDIIKNKTILSDSKTLLEQSNVSLQQKQENLLNQKLIDFNEVYSNLDDKQRKDIINESIKEIIVSKIDDGLYNLKFVTTYGMYDDFRVIPRKKIVYFLNDDEEWEELDYEYVKRLDYIR